jgi:hypothetical protein
MRKVDPNKQHTFEFDDQATNVISEQIMDAYNSGYVDQGTAIAENDDSNSTQF